MQPLTRVLLKLSGESLKGDGDDNANLDPVKLNNLAKNIVTVIDKTSIDLCLVIGGGNLMRGATMSQDKGVTRDVADRMGMLATVFNALALQDVLEKLGHETRVMSGFEMPKLCEPYIGRRAKRHLEKKRIVIFAGGLGETHFSTDTTAAQRACELRCDAVLKATNVDGVYNKDPNQHSDAKRYTKVSFSKAKNDNLEILDSTAFGLCEKNDIPIMVFALRDAASLLDVLHYRGHYTLISRDSECVYS